MENPALSLFKAFNAYGGKTMPKLNMKYYNGEIDDDLPWKGVIDVDPETGLLFDEDGDVLDKKSLAEFCDGGKGDDE